MKTTKKYKKECRKVQISLSFALNQNVINRELQIEKFYKKKPE